MTQTFAWVTEWVLGPFIEIPMRQEGRSDISALHGLCLKCL